MCFERLLSSTLWEWIWDVVSFLKCNCPFFVLGLMFLRNTFLQTKESAYYSGSLMNKVGKSIWFYPSCVQGSFNHMNRGALSCDSSPVRFMWFQPMASSYDCSVARFMWLQPMTSSYDSSLVRFIWFQPLASSYDCSVVRFMWLQLSRRSFRIVTSQIFLNPGCTD